jgi:hypothetical protein
MLLKMGVDISRLKKEIRRILGIIEFLYMKNGEEAVITSTYEGTHSPQSLHYANLAIDIRIPHTGNPADMTTKLKQNLNKDYDVVLEKDHIHIEYDPK